VTDAAGTVAVTLSVSPTLEDRLVDWLLARSDVAAFTSGVVHAYGADSGALSLAEQVSGRQRRVELTVELPVGAIATWLEDVATAFAAMDVRYRVTPVLLSGHLRADPHAAANTSRSSEHGRSIVAGHAHDGMTENVASGGE
jgi:hypothetical protein